MNFRNPIFVARLNPTAAASALTDSPSNYANLYRWWKADSYVGADGDAVSTWVDSSTSASNATALTTARPTYKTSIYNGQPCMRFNGTTNVMTIASLQGVSSVTAWSIIGVGLVSASNLSNSLLSGNASGDDFIRQSFDPGTGDRIGLRIFELATGYRVSTGFTTGPLALTMFAVAIAAGAAGPTFYENATSRGAQGSFEDTPVFDRLGGAISPWKGDICEICFYRADISGAPLTSLYTNYFKPKWGLA